MFNRYPHLKIFVLLAVMVAVLVPLNMASAGDGRPVTVMSRNAYLGASLDPLFEAIASGSPLDIGAAVLQTYGAAMSSDIPGRAAGIAREIAEYEPHLVGLQEVVVWNGPYGGADTLASLLAALENQGLSYEAIAVSPGFSQVIPFPQGFTIALEMNDVILARTDLPANQLSLANIQTGQYATRVEFDVPGLGYVAVPRQWAAVDATVKDITFRFISTHLESIGPDFYPQYFRVQQASELLMGPAATSMPVIVVGDLNSEPHVVGDAANMILGAGFSDAWASGGDGTAGNTCCHPADLGDPSSVLVERIDLVLMRGGFETLGVDLVGESRGDFQRIGRWPSDHAGVIATLRPLADAG